MTLKTLKKFNENGMREFSDFIEKTRKSEDTTVGQLPLPASIFDNTNTEELDNKIKIDVTKKFSDRLEMAKYLSSQLGGYSKKYEDYSMWAWLCATFLDQLRPKKTNRMEHYVPNGYYSNGRFNYRHSVLMPVRLVNDFEAKWCTFLLKGKLDTMGDPIEHTMGNQHTTKSAKLRAVVLKLYSDKATGLAKSGAFSTPKNQPNSIAGKGGMLRFNSDLRDRLRKNFDYEDPKMKVDDIIFKLGREISNSRWNK